MPQSIGSLALQLTANSYGLTEGLSKGTALISQFVGINSTSLGKFAGVASNALSSMGHGDILGLAKQIPYVGNFVAALEPLVGPLFAAAAGAETAQLRFTSLFGSADKAASALRELKTLSLGSGFSMAALEPAARNLAQAGIAADKLIPSMKAIAGVSAATGTPIEELAGHIAHVVAKGHIGERDLAHLVPVMDQLAVNAGVTRDQLKGMFESGAIGPKQLMTALGDLTQQGGRFSDALAKRAGSMAGAWDIAGEQIKSVVGTLGKTMVSGLAEGFGGTGEGMKGFVDFITWVKKGIQDLRPVFVWIGEFARTKIALIAQAWDDFVKPAIDAVSGWLSKLGISFGDAGDWAVAQEKAMATGFAYVVDAVKMGVGYLALFESGILRFSANVADLGAIFLRVFGPTLSKVLGGAFNLFVMFQDGVIGTFRFITVQAVGLFASVGNYFRKYFVDPIIDALRYVLGMVLEALGDMRAKIPEKLLPQGFDDLQKGVNAAAGALADVKLKAAEMFPRPEQAKAAVNAVFDGIDAGNKKVNDAIKSSITALGDGTAQAALEKTRDILNAASEAAKKLGLEWSAVKFGDGAKAVDAWFAKVKARADAGFGEKKDWLHRQLDGMWGGDPKMDLGADMKQTTGTIKAPQLPDLNLAGSAGAAKTIGQFQLENQLAGAAKDTVPEKIDQVKVAVETVRTAVDAVVRAVATAGRTVVVAM